MIISLQNIGYINSRFYFDYSFCDLIKCFEMKMKRNPCRNRRLYVIKLIKSKNMNS